MSIIPNVLSALTTSAIIPQPRLRSRTTRSGSSRSGRPTWRATKPPSSTAARDQGADDRPDPQPAEAASPSP